MSFPLSLQIWHTSSRAMSLRCLPVPSQAGHFTQPVPLQLGHSMYRYLRRQSLRTIWERERSYRGSAWPYHCRFFKKLSPQGKAENKSFKSG
jgi:hypothetical protein